MPQQVTAVFEVSAKENLIKFSNTKTLVLLVAPPRYNVETSPHIYLGEIVFPMWLSLCNLATI